MPGPGSLMPSNPKLEDYSKSVESASENTGKASDAMGRAADAMDKVSESLGKMLHATDAERKTREESDKKLRKLETAVSATESALNTISSVINVVTATTGTALTKNLGDAIDKVANGMATAVSVLAPEMAPLAAIADAAVHAWTAQVRAADDVTMVQRAAGESVLAMGGSAKETGLGFKTMADSMISAGTQLNIEQEQAAKMAQSFSEAGIAVGATTSSMSRGQAATDALAHSVGLAALMHSANGLELGRSTEIVSRLGTQFQLSGPAMDSAYASFVTGAHKAGVGITVFSKEFDSVSDSIKTLGGSADEASALTSTFAKQLQRGTVTAQQLAAGYSTEAGGFDKMIERATMIMQHSPDMAAKMGLRQGMSMDEILHTMMSDRGKSAYEASGGAAGLAQTMAKEMGGQNQLLVFQKLYDLFSGSPLASPEEYQKQFEHPEKLDLTREESVADTMNKQRDASAVALKNLSTAGEKAADSARKFSDKLLEIDRGLGKLGREGFVLAMKKAGDFAEHPIGEGFMKERREEARGLKKAQKLWPEISRTRREHPEGNWDSTKFPADQDVKELDFKKLMPRSPTGHIKGEAGSSTTIIHVQAHVTVGASRREIGEDIKLACSDLAEKITEQASRAIYAV